LAEICFESVKIPSLYIGNSQVFTLYSESKDSGIVIESGESISNIVPIYESKVIKDGIPKFDITGSVLTENLLCKILFFLN
jgi:actin-related protein